MTAIFFVSTRLRRIQVGETVWTSRSEAPFRFIALLWRHARQRQEPAWLTVADLGGRLGASTHPRQLQRVVDFLADTGLVAWETRTRGRYRLAIPVEQVVFDLDDVGLQTYLGISDAPLPVVSENALDGRTLRGMLDEVLRMDSAVFDGVLSGWPEAMPALDAVAQNAEWASVLLLRSARRALRQGARNTVSTRLAEISTLARSGGQPLYLAEVRAALLAAKSCYDRGLFAEAGRLLQGSGGANCGDQWTQGMYHNIAGLCEYRKWRGEMECRQAAGELSSMVDETGLRRAEQHYLRALFHETSISDYQGLQATTFNLANAYLTPIYLGLNHDPTWLEEGLHWLSQCRYINRHFFVGMDSVWAHILVLQAALASERTFTEINTLSGCILGSLDNLHDAAKHTLEMAEKIGNPAEIEAARSVLRIMQGQQGKG